MPADVHLPIRYPDLPIVARRQELLEVLAANQVVVVAGETGSGKSTQLPKLCLELGRGRERLIGHTQPRRLAARTVAERVAEELGVRVGGAVGYAVRFTDRVGEETALKVMTDGILLAEIQRDPKLSAYDTIILDEAHERSLNVDFLLGYLHRLLPTRPDLKLIITSATIDTERFADHFEAPVVSVSGRSYPVEVRYRPFGEQPDDRDQVEAVCDAVTELWTEDLADVLVFLSGEREIHDTADALRRLDLPYTEILPLYARLSAAEQHRVFESHRSRRVVLATNVAETSLTVPGIRSVVDAGTARISRYSQRLKVQRLPIEPISRASADQRAGRCGRVAPGVCIRLYSEQDHLDRPEYTEPEILRTSLASVLLAMATLRLGAVEDFPFVDAPDPRAVTGGVQLLEELGAFRIGEADPRRRLTKLGRRLARLPVDPRLARMILEADRVGGVREVLIIAAGMSIQDPRERPADRRQEAADLHARFQADGSDFLAYVRLWDHLETEARQRSGSAFRRMCRAEHLHYLRVREWQDLVRQLRHVCRSVGVRVPTGRNHSQSTDRSEAIHRSVLAGLLSQIGMRDGDRREYQGARNARFVIAPGSALAGSRPRWVVVGELVETNRLWGRVAGRIRPEWAEHLGAHLVKASHGDPRWDMERGTAVATERVTLYGLPLVTDRTVNYERIDRAAARSLFVAHALVAGDWEEPYGFVARNRSILEEARSVLERTRRTDLVLDNSTLFAFYDRQVGEKVTSAARFNRWWRSPANRERVTLTVEDLVGEAEAKVDDDAYPQWWVLDDVELGLTYEFDPTSPTDGVMVHIPVDVLNQLDPRPFSWQVPGLCSELVDALLRSLPKDLRRQLNPVAEWVEELADLDPRGDRWITDVLAEELAHRAGVRVRSSDWRWSHVPRNLRPSFAVIDDAGRPLAAGKDLVRLKERMRPSVADALADAFPDVRRSDLQEWEMTSLPRVVEATRPGRVVRGYPALFHAGDSVRVEVLPTPADQRAAHRAGVRRLLLDGLGTGRRELTRALDRPTTLALAAHAEGRLTELLDDALAVAVDSLVGECGGLPWDRASFERLQRAARREVRDRATNAVGTAARLLERGAEAHRRLDLLVTDDVSHAAVDIRVQLNRLLGPGMLVRAGLDRLHDLERYAEAIHYRLDRLRQAPARDRDRTVLVQRLENELAAAGLGPSRSAEVSWDLEELRVSLFAQAIGVAAPVSEKRIRDKLHGRTTDR